MIIVTTSNSILKIEENDILNYKIIETGNGLYYGIDYYENKLYVAARKRLTSSTNSPISEEDGEIRVFDKEFQLVEVIKATFPLRDIHQIRFIDDDLYVTCTHDNMIAIRNKKGEWRKWFPLPKAKLADINHFNTIDVDGDKIVICCHNKEEPSEVIYFDKSLNFLMKFKLGRQIHNYWKEGDEIFTNSSKDSKIISNKGFSMLVGEFPRGYCKIDDKNYIGVSKILERPARDTKFNNGKINIYDKHYNLIESINLSSQGLISDIYYIKD